MMTQEQLDRLKKKLDSSIPLIGTFSRKGAVKELLLNREDPQVVGLLLEVLPKLGQVMSEEVQTALKGVSSRDGVNALCEAAIRDPGSVAARLCQEAGKRPSDHERACLYLFVSGQLDAYFQEDDDFQALRQEYDRADDKLKHRIMKIIRSGDKRCTAFFGRRKKLRECNEGEIRLALESALKHKDWPNLFKAFMELPLKYGFPLLHHFRTSGWQPETPEMQSLYRQVLEDAGDSPLPEPKARNKSCLFERWLAQGNDPVYANLSESDLLEKLKQADPPEGVSIAAALATKIKPGSPAANSVMTNDHWLVRLAGHAMGFSKDVAGDVSAQDSNYWVNQLVNASGVLNFWPGDAKPADLEALRNAPSESYVGQLGAVRKVLRTLVGSRITTGVFEEMAVEAGEFAGEFAEVSDDSIHE